MAQATVYSSSGQQQNPQQQPPPPKPPWRQPHKDGQSQAAQHYDLFEMIRHPNLARENRPPDPPPPKKYATKQQQIEGELEKKFKRSAKTGILITLIKAFVFAGFFPFYLLFIAIPRLIYTFIAGLLAKLRDYMRQKVEAVKQFFLRRYHNVVDPFKKLWKRMSDLEKNKMALDFDDDDLGFFAFIAMGVYYAYSGIVRPTIRGVKAFYRSLIASYRWTVERPQKAREAFERKWTPVRHFIESVKAYPAKLFRRLKGKLLAATLYPLIAKYQDYKVRTVAAYARFQKAVLGAYKNVKDAILHPVQTIHRLREGLRNAYQRKREQIKAAWIRFIAHPVRFFKKMQVRLAEFALAIRSKLPNVQLKLPYAKRLQAWKKNLSGTIERLAARFSFKLPWYLQFSKPKVNLNPRHLDNLMKAAVRKLLTSLAERLRPKIAHLQGKILSGYEMLARPVRLLNAKIEASYDRLQLKIQRFFRPVRRFAHRRILRIRLFVGWIRVIARHSLKSFQDGRL